MLSTFCGTFDVPHCKKEDKVDPAMVDLYDQNMGGAGSSDQVMHSYAFERKSKSWSKKSCIQPSYAPSNEFLHTL